jgi:hypothetical protein
VVVSVRTTETEADVVANEIHYALCEGRQNMESEIRLIQLDIVKVEWAEDITPPE